MSTVTIGKIGLAPRTRRRVLLALGWYAGQIHYGVAKFARDAGWILNVESLRSGTAPPGWHGDGIIAILGSNSQMDRQLIFRRLPMVNIGHGGPASVPTVRADDRAIAVLAVDHFATRGFRHYTFGQISGGPGETARYRHFAAEIAARGFTLHSLDWASHAGQRKSAENGRIRWLSRRLAAMPKPLAVFAEFDDRAIELLHACELAGIRVPDQAAVLGVDNDELRCELAPVPLSSINDDQEQQGYSAAAMLEQFMGSGKRPANDIMITPRDLVTRQSSDILAVEHEIVAGALRAIWEHYRKPILAEDIARMFPVSTRRLHDAFCKNIGHSISAELTRKRVEYAKELLATTDSKLAVIAKATGFSSPDHMTKVFTRLIGITPSDYRKRPAAGG
jgi:LacI family transcriptional regulator